MNDLFRTETIFYKFNFFFSQVMVPEIKKQNNSVVIDVRRIQFLFSLKKNRMIIAIVKNNWFSIVIFKLFFIYTNPKFSIVDFWNDLFSYINQEPHNR